MKVTFLYWDEELSKCSYVEISCIWLCIKKLGLAEIALHIFQ